LARAQSDCSLLDYHSDLSIDRTSHLKDSLIKEDENAGTHAIG